MTSHVSVLICARAYVCLRASLPQVTEEAVRISTRPQLFNTGVAQSLVAPDSILVESTEKRRERLKQEKEARGGGAPVPKTYAEESAMCRQHLDKQLRVRVARNQQNFCRGLAIEEFTPAILEGMNGQIQSFFGSHSDPASKNLTADEAFTWVYHEVALNGYAKHVYAEALQSYERGTKDLMNMLAPGALGGEESVDGAERYRETLAGIDAAQAAAAEQLRTIVIAGVGPLELVDNKWQQVPSTATDEPTLACSCVSVFAHLVCV